jgi:hypothetical protein
VGGAGGVGAAVAALVDVGAALVAGGDAVELVVGVGGTPLGAPLVGAPLVGAPVVGAPLVGVSVTVPSAPGEVGVVGDVDVVGVVSVVVLERSGR